MKRSTAWTCSVWLLPLLAVRLMVPVGFMLHFADGSPQWVFCTDRAATADAGHAHHSADHGADHTAATADDTTQSMPEQCPFALLGTGLLSGVATAASVDRLPATQPLAGVARSIILAARTDSHLIRGPPSLS